MASFAVSAVRRRQFASLGFNTAIVALEIAGLNLSIRIHGKSLFQFYTEDSNIFALLACALCAVYTAVNLRKGQRALPQWVKLVKYTATCCLTVTFVVVAAVLAPMNEEGGYWPMLVDGSMLYHHLLCPILAVLSFVFLEPDPPLLAKHTWITLIPTLLYAVVILILNITRTLAGPYPFLHVYEQPVTLSAVWFALILGGAYLAAWLLRLANRRGAQ